MDGAVTLRLATGPVSWGVDFADVPGNPPWQAVVAGIAAAGYRWTELGPLGYLPAEADAELERLGIGVTGGFAFEPLHDPSRLERTLVVAGRTARRIALAGGRFFVIIDAVSPERAATAGRPEAPRLDRKGAAALARAVDAIADVARDHRLLPLVHPHAGTHIEFPDEVEPLLELADLCLDTGHCAYAGLDPVELYRHWADRIPYLHLKDIDPARQDGDFWASVRAGVFRPLGEGIVDLPALLAALGRHDFDGWAVVEQDRLPGGDPVGDLIASRRALEAAR
jgi:inosose dehydratase